MRQALSVPVHEFRIHQRFGKRDAGAAEDGAVRTALVSKKTGTKAQRDRVAKAQNKTGTKGQRDKGTKLKKDFRLF